SVKVHVPVGEHKLYFDKINGSDLFDASGQLDAGLNLQLQVGFEGFGTFVGYQKRFEIAGVTLFKFGDKDQPTPLELPGETDGPAIAGVNKDTGVLTLFMGPNADKLTHGLVVPNGGNENYYVDQFINDAGERITY